MPDGLRVGGYSFLDSRKKLSIIPEKNMGGIHFIITTLSG